jgi:nucleoside-diphosphate-sugar epimerase
VPEPDRLGRIGSRQFAGSRYHRHLHTCRRTASFPVEKCASLWSRGDVFTDVPHFTGKYTVERMIEDYDLPVTILRPSYFIQNDTSMKDAALLGHGVYPQPIGSKGISIVDTRDIAEAALSLLKREHAAGPLAREVIELVGPDPLTGEAIAGIWSEVLGRQIRYGGDDLAAFEKRCQPRDRFRLRPPSPAAESGSS